MFQENNFVFILQFKRRTRGDQAEIHYTMLGNTQAYIVLIKESLSLADALSCRPSLSQLWSSLRGEAGNSRKTRAALEQRYVVAIGVVCGFSLHKDEEKMANMPKGSLVTFTVGISLGISITYFLAVSNRPVMPKPRGAGIGAAQFVPDNPHVHGHLDGAEGPESVMRWEDSHEGKLRHYLSVRLLVWCDH